MPGAVADPLTPGAEGGLCRTLLLSTGLLGLFSGMVEAMAGSDILRAGVGLGALGSCINMRGPVAPISC